MPKLIPENDSGYRSGAITYDYDQSLSISPAALAVLNAHNFYSRDWSPTIVQIMNDSFEMVVTTFSAYVTPLSEAARKFSGVVVARCSAESTRFAIPISLRSQTDPACSRSFPPSAADLYSAKATKTLPKSSKNRCVHVGIPLPFHCPNMCSSDRTVGMAS